MSKANYLLIIKSLNISSVFAFFVKPHIASDTAISLSLILDILSTFTAIMSRTHKPIRLYSFVIFRLLKSGFAVLMIELSTSVYTTFSKLIRWNRPIFATIRANFLSQNAVLAIYLSFIYNFFCNPTNLWETKLIKVSFALELALVGCTWLLTSRTYIA